MLCVKFHRLVCTLHVSSSTGRCALSSTGWCAYVNFHRLLCVKFHRLVCTLHVSSSTGRCALRSTGWCAYVNFHRLCVSSSTGWCALCMCQVPQVGVYMSTSTSWCVHCVYAKFHRLVCACVNFHRLLCACIAYPRRCLGVGGRCVQFYSKRQSNAILPFFLPSFVTRTSGAALQCL